MALATPSGGIEELVDETSGKEVVVVPSLGNNFEDLTLKYFSYLNDGNYSHLRPTEILNPSDINAFLQNTQEYESHENYVYRTGTFVTELVRRSYDAGNNNFYVDLRCLRRLFNVGNFLKGAAERLVKMKVLGKTGNSSAGYTKYVDITFEETGNDCGRTAEKSCITVQKTGAWCGQDALNSTFHIGTAEEYCGLRAVNSLFVVDTTQDDVGYEALNSVFKTATTVQLERLKKNLPHNKKNKVFFIHPDGSEQEVLF